MFLEDDQPRRRLVPIHYLFSLFLSWDYSHRLSHRRDSSVAKALRLFGKKSTTTLLYRSRIVSRRPFRRTFALLFFYPIWEATQHCNLHTRLRSETVHRHSPWALTTAERTSFRTGIRRRRRRSSCCSSNGRSASAVIHRAQPIDLLNSRSRVNETSPLAEQVNYARDSLPLFLALSFTFRLTYPCTQRVWARLSCSFLVVFCMAHPRDAELAMCPLVLLMFLKL